MKIGILGGSFDPVHTGHIELAKKALCLGLDKVIFVPTGTQPFKCDIVPASDSDRAEMLKIAIKGMCQFEISYYEMEKEGLSYTINTLRAMKEIYEDAEIFFIIGIDAFLEIERWKGAEDLLNEFSFIIGMRPGYREEQLEEVIARIEHKYGTKMVKINNPMIDISSTEIRQYVKTGCWAEADGKIPPQVKEYIIRNEVYN